MKQRVIDTDHDRFNQIGELVKTEEIARHLNMYRLKFGDEEEEYFLAYQIIGVLDESR